ncbi:FecR family protein [Flavobacteriaceae bacterium F08102]|nr:FecR family protein [Flavobacteriaceae bacterium F08102]
MELRGYFTKIIVGTISEQETDELMKLLEIPEHKELFEKYIKDYHYLNLSLQKNDSQEAYANVLSQINLKDKPTRKLYSRLLKYAAAIIILISTGYLLTKNQLVNVPTAVIDNEIPIGTDKATLTLEDGSSIALEKGTVYKDEKVSSDGEKIVYQPKPDESIEKLAYNYLTIPRGGEFYLELEDGTKVWLNSESKLKYPVKFIDGQTRAIELVYGEVYLEVSPSTNHNGDGFRVKTNDQYVDVLGTQFNVKSYQNEDVTETILVEGKVKVTVKNKSEYLDPNQQLVFDRKKNTFKINLVDAVYETAWKSGYFKFRNKTFFEVSKVLERWYNVEFIFQNKEVEQLKIVGVLSKYNNLEQFLITLKNTNNINYKINKNTIYIH